MSVLLVFVLVEVATSGAGKLGAGEGATSAAPKPVTTSPEMAVSAAKTTDASTVANDAAVDPGRFFDVADTDADANSTPNGCRRFNSGHGCETGVGAR